MHARDEAFTLLSAEVRRLFHQLAAIAATLQEPEGLSAGHRSVLESLMSSDQTVPELARSRPVSRQHIQILINELLTRRLVESVPNPAHRRSSLIRLTTRGRALFDSIRERERAWLAAARLPVTVAEMDAAANTLRLVREHLGHVQSGSDKHED